MENCTLKIIRWILLIPLTLVVPTIVSSLFRGSGFIYHNAPSFWNFMEGMAPLVAQWFMPALLTVPIACAVAPSHREKVSLITFIFMACFWLFAFSVLPKMDTGLFYEPDNRAFIVSMLCVLLFGLAAGFAVVRFALRRRRRAL